MQENEGMIPRGRGTGRPYPNRGRGRHQFNEIVQGNRRLIASSSSNAYSSSGSMDAKTFQEFLEFKRIREEQENSPDSYKNVTIAEQLNFEENDEREIIFLLENKDKNYMDNGPWFLMERYIHNVNYAQEANKPRTFYEGILIKSQSCEFEHSPTEIPYTFSKFIIKKIISSEEWGLSTMKDQEIRHPQTGYALRYNYWDYIQGFNKSLLYENDKRKHTWFIKVCHKVNNLQIPNWFLHWWQFYGPSEKILIEPFNKVYEEWANSSQKLITFKEKFPKMKKISSFLFFTEFSIPWILKWDIEFGETNYGLPCIKRKFLTKFWKKMADTNPETQKIFGQETYDEILATIKADKSKRVQEEKQKQAMPDFFQQFQKQIAQKNLSQEELVKEYLETMKKDLMKNLHSKNSSTSSMEVNSDQESNQFSVLAGESQDPYEDEDPNLIIDMVDIIQDDILTEMDLHKSRRQQ